MKRLRTILQSKIFLTVLIIFTIFYVVVITKNNYYNSNYREGEQEIVGNIIKIKIDGNKVSLTLKGDEKILVNYYADTKEELNNLKKYQIGDKIIVSGIIKIPSENTNFYLFNYRKYLLSKKIYYIMDADKINLIDKNNNLFYKIKNIIIDRINNFDSKSYLKAFLIGDNSDIDEDIKESFQTNGISHLFAISGLHVTMFSNIILFILNKISKNKKLNFFIISSILIFYMFLTGISPSIIRATLFFILINLNSYLKLKIKTINLFIILLCIVLIYNPYNIYNNAFLFSYIISFYLIIFNSIINRHNNYFIKIFITSFISFCASIPIMINSYFSINLISFIFNLFYVPYVTFLLFPISLITFICPMFDNILNILINVLENTSLYLAKFDCFLVILRHIPFSIIILYYILITFIFIMMNKRKYKYIILLVIVLMFHTNYNKFNNIAYLTVIDVGQGDSILIVLPNDKGNILIDTGGKINYIKESWMKKQDNSISINTIIPYLKAEGIKRIDYLVLTHGDYDHMGESINLVNNFKVEKVIFNCGEFNELELELIKTLDNEKIPYYNCIKELNINNNILYFLNNGSYDNENDNSSVIYTELNNYKFLFMGDAGVEVEEDLLEKYNLNNIDILKVGHHGSKTSSGEKFINKINPKYSIISVGKSNRYGHPNNEVLENLENSNIYRTDIDGSIMFKIKDNELKIEICAP